MSSTATPLDVVKAAADMGPPEDASEFVGPPVPDNTEESATPDPKSLLPKDMFSGLKDSLGGALGGLKDSLGSALKGVFSGPDSLLGGLGDMLKGGLSSLMSSISGGLGGIMSFFGFADGGFVSGPGTGTSDSIPAMLSNGEFVVNAAATQRFAPLLHSINSGSFGKFADGGMVGASMIAVPTAADIRPSSSQPSGQQIVNLNITGDISRQTKSEIYRMLPTITQGVNSQNREAGYKR